MSTAPGSPEVDLLLLSDLDSSSMSLPLDLVTTYLSSYLSMDLSILNLFVSIDVSIYLSSCVYLSLIIVDLPAAAAVSLPGK